MIQAHAHQDGEGGGTRDRVGEQAAPSLPYSESIFTLRKCVRIAETCSHSRNMFQERDALKGRLYIVFDISHAALDYIWADEFNGWSTNMVY